MKCELNYMRSYDDDDRRFLRISLPADCVNKIGRTVATAIQPATSAATELPTKNFFVADHLQNNESEQYAYIYQILLLCFPRYLIEIFQWLLLFWMNRWYRYMGLQLLEEKYRWKVIANDVTIEFLSVSPLYFVLVVVCSYLFHWDHADEYYLEMWMWKFVVDHEVCLSHGQHDYLV